MSPHKEIVMKSQLVDMEGKIVEKIMKNDKVIRKDIKMLENANYNMLETVKDVEKRASQHSVTLNEVIVTQNKLEEKLNELLTKSDHLEQKVEEKLGQLFVEMEAKAGQISRKIDDLESKISAEQGKNEKTKRIFKCDECGISFHLEYHLHNHLIKHKSKNFECDACGKKFPNAEHFEGHMKKKHSF